MSGRGGARMGLRGRHRERRHIALFLVYALLLSVVVTAAGVGSPARALAEFSCNRIGGENRDAPAAMIAGAAFPDGAAAAILARAADFADAMAGAFLAGIRDPPVLLVATDPPVHEETLAALRKLRVRSVILL